MNYDEARPLKAGGWHWTTMNDGVVRTAQPCIRHVGEKSDPFWYMQPSKPEDWVCCEPHATREEAERHFYDWCLSTVEESRMSDQQLRCRVAGCDGWSDVLLGNRQLGHLFNGDPLCEAHRSKDQLALLHPFKPGMVLVHS